jgi:hypothetical protein
LPATPVHDVSSAHRHSHRHAARHSTRKEEAHDTTERLTQIALLS